MPLTRSPHRSYDRPAKRIDWRDAVPWILLLLAIAVSVLPFYWVLRTSLSMNSSLAANATSLLPVGFNFGAFERVFGLQSTQEAIAQGGSGADINFWVYLRNSVVFASITTAGAVFFSAMAAYAFSRLRWRGRNVVFSAFLATVLPFIFMTPFAVFFLRQFFMNMSREVEEAAMLDGAKHFRIFFQIILPNAAAPIATLVLLTFIQQWNEYFWPLLVGNSADVRVLTVGLGVFKSQSPQGAPDWSGLMAATLISALPVLTLFMIFGKKIVNSIGFSGVK